MGILNIFLGGTGKYVGENCSTVEAAWPGLQFPPYFAFDLNPARGHTAGISLADSLTTVPQRFGTYVQKELAPAWAGEKLDDLLKPGTAGPGPRVSPSAELLRRIGVDVAKGTEPQLGLWGLRAAGLLVFAGLNEPEWSAQLQSYRQILAHRLTQAAMGDGAVTVHLYSSAAGGTGAGMFLPFTLWMRQVATGVGLAPHAINFRLFLVAASAFDSVYDDGAAQVELRSKANSGMFAIMRELDLLDKIPGDTTQLPRRTFMLGPTQLSYRAGQSGFSNVFWIGRRASAVGAPSTEVLDEAGLIAQAMSSSALASQIAAVVNPHGPRLAFAATSVEYPRRRLAEQQSGAVIGAIYGALKSSPTAARQHHRLAGFGGVAPEQLARFVVGEQDLCLGRGANGNIPAQPENWDALVASLSDADQALRSVPIGEQRPQGRGIYAEGEEDPRLWKQYCFGLFTDLDNVAANIPAHTLERVRMALVRHSPQFARWLHGSVVGASLNPPNANMPPTPIKTVLEDIADIEADLQSVYDFFDKDATVTSRVEQPGVTASDRDWHTKPIDEVVQQIAAQKKNVLDPPTGERRSLSTARWFGAAAVAIVVAIAGLLLSALLVKAPLTLVIALVAGLAAFFIATRVLRETESIEERRKSQEARLLALYREFTLAYAGKVVLEETRRDFVAPARQTIKALKDRLSQLQLVYSYLQAEAISRTRGMKPAHCVKEILPPAVNLPDNQIWLVANQYIPYVRVRPQISENGDLTDLELAISPDGDLASPRVRFGQVSALAEYVAARQNGGNQIGYVSGQSEMAQLDDALTETVVGGIAGGLPATFDAAALQWLGAPPDVQIAAAVSALMHCAPGGVLYPGGVDRTQSSMDLGGTGGGIVFQQLITGNQQVNQLINNSLPHIRDLARVRLDRYLQPGGIANVCPQVGEAIVALTVYQLGPSLRDVPEMRRAAGYYYQTMDAPGLINYPAAFYSQQRVNFQIIPELEAAAEIELSDPHRMPLHSAVTARLYGSHLRGSGPSLIELFYLARAKAVLVELQPTVEGIVRRQLFLRPPAEVKEFLPGQGEGMTLLTAPLALPDAGGDPFGEAGRWSVSRFDVFADFMLFSGGVVGAGGGVGDAVSTILGAPNDHVGDWLRQPSRISALQQQIVTLWFNYKDLEAETMDMLKILRADVTAMGNSPAAASWDRAAQALITSGHEKRGAASKQQKVL